jgi:hypothetical protein
MGKVDAITVYRFPESPLQIRGYDQHERVVKEVVSQSPHHDK